MCKNDCGENMTAYCVPKDRLQETPLSGTLSNMLKITLTAAIAEASVKYTELIYMITWYESSMYWLSVCSKRTYYSYFWDKNKLAAGKTPGFQCLLPHPCPSWRRSQGRARPLAWVSVLSFTLSSCESGWRRLCCWMAMGGGSGTASAPSSPSSSPQLCMPEEEDLDSVPLLRPSFRPLCNQTNSCSFKLGHENQALFTC